MVSAVQRGYTPVSVKLLGTYACFTRPEMKVERVTYDVMTPSAARGCLEAIYWVPQFQWQVRSIAVLRPIRHFSITRNEIRTRPSRRALQGLQEADRHFYVENDRTQRHTLALRDVEYIVRADVVPRRAEEDPARYRDQFRRRVTRGQCFRQPYLGCREFPADFEEPSGHESAIDHSRDLGLMLFDLVYSSSDTPGRVTAQPRFFAAHLESGLMSVPPRLYAHQKGDQGERGLTSAG